MFGLKAKLFGGEPRAYRQEIGSSRGGYSTTKSTTLAAGLAANTVVATAMGWRVISAITAGDLVLTFDRGLRPVKAVTFGHQWGGAGSCPKSMWPVQVPAGALGNAQEMTLQPEQCVMLESDSADMLFGDPFSMVAAANLEGFRGIHRVRPQRDMQGDMDVVQLHFDDDEVVFANSGTLAFCPSLRVINMAELMSARPEAAPYMPVSAQDAALLLACLKDEDFDAALMPKPATHQPNAACA